VAKKAPGADQCTEAVDHIEILLIVPGITPAAARIHGSGLAQRAIFP